VSRRQRRGRQLSLLPGSDDDLADDYGPPKASVTPIATSGRTEYTAHCPRCQAVHRHNGPGVRRGPCGALYTIPAD
jgi:hypothetical protein